MSLASVNKKCQFDSKVLLGRTLVLCFILLVILTFDYFSRSNGIISFELIYLLILVGFVQVAATVNKSKGADLGPVFKVSQIGFDLFIISSIVYITGTSLSPFSFLYLPLVMMVANTGQLIWAMTVALIGGSIYYSLSYLVLIGLIPPYDTRYPIFEPIGGLALNSVGLTSGMILVGYLTYILRSRILLNTELVTQSLTKLEQLDKHYSSILNGITQPTIIINHLGTIIRLNESARSAFLLDESVVGESLFEVFKKYVPHIKSLINHLNSGEDIQVEIKLTNDESRYYRIALQTLTSSESVLERCLIFNDLTELATAEERLAAHERMILLLSRKKPDYGDDKVKIDNMIGESRSIRNVYEMVSKVASSDVNVLIQGESGTGKELVARAIHTFSPRSSHPFITVNCGAIPIELVESHFFGHVKGAFTGADRNHDGFFKEADKGTLFLDEVAELPLLMQVKLLRVIQEQMIRPVGSAHEFKINVRILAASHKPLDHEVKAGNFREDLLYRLNVVTIPIPALRQRRDDIPLLVDYFIRKSCGNSRELPLIHPETLDLLRSYNYPGNVRELQNLIERALIFADKAILPDHLPKSVLENVNLTPVDIVKLPTEIIQLTEVSLPCNLDIILNEVEKKHIIEALCKSNGNRNEAAKMLGINQRSLRYRMSKLEVSS